MKKIVFSKHALEDKFTELEKHNFRLTESDITAVVKHPDNLDKESDKPKIIASKDLDKKHILRVVYNRFDKTLSSQGRDEGRRGLKLPTTILE